MDHQNPGGGAGASLRAVGTWEESARPGAQGRHSGGGKARSERRWNLPGEGKAGEGILGGWKVMGKSLDA